MDLKGFLFGVKCTGRGGFKREHLVKLWEELRLGNKSSCAKILMPQLCELVKAEIYKQGLNAEWVNEKLELPIIPTSTKERLKNVEEKVDVEVEFDQNKPCSDYHIDQLVAMAKKYKEYLKLTDQQIDSMPKGELCDRITKLQNKDKNSGKRKEEEEKNREKTIKLETYVSFMLSMADKIVEKIDYLLKGMSVAQIEEICQRVKSLKREQLPLPVYSLNMTKKEYESSQSRELMGPKIKISDLVDELLSLDPDVEIPKVPKKGNMIRKIVEIMYDNEMDSNFEEYYNKHFQNQ